MRKSHLPPEIIKKRKEIGRELMKEAEDYFKTRQPKFRHKRPI